MFRNSFQHIKRHPSEENENDDDDDEYFIPDIFTVTTTKTSTEVLIGLQQKPQKVIDWLPVLSIISAIIICLIAFIVLCKRQIDHHRYVHSQQKRQRNNRNNNQRSLLSVDVAECIDDNIEFISGLNILLAKGNLILDDDHARMLNSLNTFDRLQYFQKLVTNVK